MPTYTVEVPAMLCALTAVLVGVQATVNQVIEEPYMDEYFHVQQTQAYCRGEWSTWVWNTHTHTNIYTYIQIHTHSYTHTHTHTHTRTQDDKITTLPGLYATVVGCLPSAVLCLLSAV
jgi:hypothetical protein